MILKRLALATPALVLVSAGIASTPASADTTALDPAVVNALAVANCQLDPTRPLTVAQMSPIVIGEEDIVVVPDEISAHLVRARVATSADDVRECTFGVLHRDAVLDGVDYHGRASLSLADSAGNVSHRVVTAIKIGDLPRKAPTTATIDLGGFLSPVDDAAPDPTYRISITRTSVETDRRGHHPRPVRDTFRMAGSVTASISNT